MKEYVIYSSRGGNIFDMVADNIMEETVARRFAIELMSDLSCLVLNSSG